MNDERWLGGGRAKAGSGQVIQRKKEEKGRLTLEAMEAYKEGLAGSMVTSCHSVGNRRSWNTHTGPCGCGTCVPCDIVLIARPP